MKKHTKIFVATILTLVMCFSGLTAFASEENGGISPRLSHMSGGSCSFIAGDGEGHASVSYEGYSDSFMMAKVTFKLQKRFLLVFWNDVDEWSATNVELCGFFYHIFELDGKGTYRVKMTLEVAGNDGTIDVIEDTRESTY